MENNIIIHFIGMVIKDSEASRVNLRFRDRIEKINDLPVCELSHEDIVERVTACPILHMRITPIIRWSVELERNGVEGYGFGIRGGKEFDLPLYVLRILESSPAEKSCLINVGDVIEAINDDNIGEKGT